MITKYKIFENKTKLKIGDWVIDRNDDMAIIMYYGGYTAVKSDNIYIIHYPKINHSEEIHIDNIVEFGDTKDDLQMKIQTRKYNL